MTFSIASNLGKLKEMCKIFSVAFSLVLIAGSDELFSQAEFEASSTSLSQRLASERAAFLEYIRSELEPGLIDRDAQRLRRNAMRLGSYRKRWSTEAEDFLVANAALAEWFLYDYSRVKNSHLNARIIQTLLRYESYQSPLAPLFFAEDLSVNDGGKGLLLQLFERVVRLNPSVASVYMEFVSSEWGQDLPVEDLLYFQYLNCESAAGPISGVSSAQRNSLWVRIFSTAIENCRRFL